MVSVIVPTYNSASVLGTLLESLVQYAPTSEIVIVDGLSTDGTVKVVEQFRDKLNICFLSEGDRGIYDAMNKGVQRSTGDYLYFIGADDRLLYYLDEAVSGLLPNQILYSNVVLADSGDVYGGLFTWRDILARNINHQSMVYPKAVFRHYQFSLWLPYLADYYLNLVLFVGAQFSFVFRPINLAEYSNTGVSTRKRDCAFSLFSLPIKMLLMAKFWRNR